MINWDKGKAVTFLLESLGKCFSPNKSDFFIFFIVWVFFIAIDISIIRLIICLGLHDCDVLPIYVGDDRTDEDAFKVKSYFYNDESFR